MDVLKLKCVLPAMLLLLLCFALSAGEAFNFIQISDIHLGAPGNLERLKAVVKEIETFQDDVAFVTFTGDIFDKGSTDQILAKDFEEILQSFKVPVYCLPGNHDILSGSETEDVAGFEKVAGGICKKADVKGYRLIFMCVEPLTGRVSIEGYKPLAWLEDALKDSSNPVILFIHTPPSDVFYNAKNHKGGWDKDAIAKWSELLHKYGVKAVIEGHLHRDELHWDGEIPLMAAPPVAGKFGRQATYRIYMVKADGHIEYSTQYIQRPEASGSWAEQ